MLKLVSFNEMETELRERCECLNSIKNQMPEEVFVKVKAVALKETAYKISGGVRDMLMESYPTYAKLIMNGITTDKVSFGLPSFTQEIAARYAFKEKFEATQNALSIFRKEYCR